jgi:fido (protein-threonine AMPylation protein)
MHPQDCPSWDYSVHPKKREVLGRKAKEVLVDLRRGRLDTLENATDSRRVHRRLFLELTPQGYEYYAGNYRGDSYRCLRYYDVTIPADPRVGFRAAYVLGFMRELAARITSGVGALDLAGNIPDPNFTPHLKALNVVVFACHIFEAFLRIHPYVDGNGHAARFILWAILGRYGYWPRRWPIDPRPPDPPYSELIREYRSGNREPLEAYVFSTLL